MGVGEPKELGGVLTPGSGEKGGSQNGKLNQRMKSAPGGVLPLNMQKTRWNP